MPVIVSVMTTVVISLIEQMCVGGALATLFTYMVLLTAHNAIIVLQAFCPKQHFQCSTMLLMTTVSCSQTYLRVLVPNPSVQHSGIRGPGKIGQQQFASSRLSIPKQLCCRSNCC